MTSPSDSSPSRRRRSRRRRPWSPPSAAPAPARSPGASKRGIHRLEACLDRRVGHPQPPLDLTQVALHVQKQPHEVQQVVRQRAQVAALEAAADRDTARTARVFGNQQPLITDRARSQRRLDIRRHVPKLWVSLHIVNSLINFLQVSRRFPGTVPGLKVFGLTLARLRVYRR